MSRTEVWSLNYSYWSLLFEVRGQYLPRRRRDLTIFHVMVLSWAAQLWRESLVARRIKTGTRMVPLRWHSTQRLAIQISSQQIEYPAKLYPMYNKRFALSGSCPYANMSWSTEFYSLQAPTHKQSNPRKPAHACLPFLSIRAILIEMWMMG